MSGGFDSFQRGNPAPRFGGTGSGTGGLSGGAGADQFVRAQTQPLAQRRVTRPLSVSPEMLEKAVGEAEQAIATCRIIVDKFLPRVRLLEHAEGLARDLLSGGARPVVEPAAAAPAVPEKKGLGKGGLLGAKKAAPKPGLGGAAASKPATAPKGPNPFNLNATELAVADGISRTIARNPQARQRTQVAIYQFQEAAEAVKAAQAIVTEVRQLAADPGSAMDRLDAFDLSKLQGKIYPVCNFNEAFRADPDIARLFPAPSRPIQKPGTGALGPPNSVKFNG